MNKNELLEHGTQRVQLFCRKNSLQMPELRIVEGSWPFKACAYYRPNYIALNITKCAPLGYGGRSWSWPGYVVDRTPYGVLCHELGHFVDYKLSGKKGSYFGDFSVKLRRDTQEDPVTTYCPNDAEWFAEIFRLFVTNHALLKELRPRTHQQLRKVFYPASRHDWQSELEYLTPVPDRTFNAALNHIVKVQKRMGRENRGRM